MPDAHGIDWAPVIQAVTALVVAIVGILTARLTAKVNAVKVDVADTKQQTAAASGKLDGVVMELDGKLQARLDEARIASHAQGVLQEKTRRDEIDAALATPAKP